MSEAKTLVCKVLMEKIAPAVASKSYFKPQVNISCPNCSLIPRRNEQEKPPGLDMGKTALKRLEDGQLVHLVIGLLLMLSLLISAAALTELVQRILGPLSGPVFLLLNLVMFYVVLAFLYTGKCDKALNKLVDLAELAEHHIETPQRLQSGYMLLRKIRAIEHFSSAVILAATAAIIGRVRVPGLGLEEMENFAKYSLTWTILLGVYLALLILASWIAGHFAGRSRRT